MVQGGQERRENSRFSACILELGVGSQFELFILSFAFEFSIGKNKFL